MASGLPVISADQGGVLENVRHGINGLVVRTGDGRQFAEAAIRLIRDQEQRAAMSQAARAFAVGRDWAREMDDLERLYTSVLSTPLGGGSFAAGRLQTFGDDRRSEPSPAAMDGSFSEIE
jgi:hypothetical protein